MIYQIVQRDLPEFVRQAHAKVSAVVQFVRKELERFLGSGILPNGFLRRRYDACQSEQQIAFCCKSRAICPSCSGRRMADTAAHWVDRVLPQVPIRQWVLSFPFALRYALAYGSQ